MMHKVIVFFVYLGEYENFVALLSAKKFRFRTLSSWEGGLVRVDVNLDDMDNMVYLFNDWFSGGLGQVKFHYVGRNGQIQHKMVICGGGYNETEYMINNSLSIELVDRSPSAFLKSVAHPIIFKDKIFLTLGYFSSGTHAQYKSALMQCGANTHTSAHFEGGIDYLVVGNKTLMRWQRKNFSHTLFTATCIQSAGGLFIVSETHCSLLMERTLAKKRIKDHF